jgi:hypothetical protein
VIYRGENRYHGHQKRLRFRVGEISVTPGGKRPRGYRYSHGWIDRDGRSWDQYVRVKERPGT